MPLIRAGGAHTLHGQLLECMSQLEGRPEQERRKGVPVGGAGEDRGCRRHHRDAVRSAAEQAPRPPVITQVGDARQAGRKLLAKDVQRCRSHRRIGDEEDAVGQPDDPAIQDDEALWCKERAVDGGTFRGLLDIVGDQSLDALHRTRARDAEDRRGHFAHEGRATKPLDRCRR